MVRVLLLVITLSTLTTAADLTVKVSGIKKSVGDVIFALFESAETYEAGEPSHGSLVAAMPGAMEFTFTDLPEGEYAIKIFHDKNSNRVLDTGFFGLPKEPYGFSNNVRPKGRGATFEESVFSAATGDIIEIVLK